MRHRLLALIAASGLLSSLPQSAALAGTPEATLKSSMDDAGGPRAKSADFIQNRGQYQLQRLSTEQRHPATWDFTEHALASTEAGLQELWRVDADVSEMLRGLAAEPEVLAQLSDAMQRAWRSGHRVLFYGCGSTGRLSRTLEALWRGAWTKLDGAGASATLLAQLPGLRGGVVGEITGGDRALISSLEGFEDLPLVGAMQMADHGIGPGDVVVAVTEGGETPSVLGAVTAAVADAGVRPKDAYLVFNNRPDDLRILERCRTVLDNPAITPLVLATGPQAIAGSTRMQATTSGLFVLGVVLDDALGQTLRAHVPADQLERLGIGAQRNWASRLGDFEGILAAVTQQGPALAMLTDAEAAAYQGGHRATYSARGALPTLFTDATERSPTFRLAPFDPIDVEARHAWLHVCTDVSTAEAAWTQLLGRPFRGIDTERYRQRIDTDVADADLRDAAERSLGSAGPDQGARYDLSAASLGRAGWQPAQGDFLLEVLLDGEAPLQVLRPAPGGRPVQTLRVTTGARPPAPSSHTVEVAVPTDLLDVRQHIAAKLLLNAHSTVIMAKLGRLVGNTMAYVQPSNLKLIGRATYLIQSHANDVRHSRGEPELSYEAANRLLFEAIEYRAEHDPDTCPPEVFLAVVRAVLEGQGAAHSWADAERGARNTTFEAFKHQHMAQ